MHKINKDLVIDTTNKSLKDLVTDMETLDNDIDALDTKVDNIPERNYNIPIDTQLYFFGGHAFTKNQWRDIVKVYGIGCERPITAGCERWVGMRVWDTDGVTSGSGLVVGWFNNAGTFMNRQFTFPLTWGTSDNDWGSYKIGAETWKVNELPSGWVVFKSIIPNDSGGNTNGYIKALWIDYYDVPIGKTPSPRV